MISLCFLIKHQEACMRLEEGYSRSNPKIVETSGDQRCPSITHIPMQEADSMSSPKSMEPWMNRDQIHIRWPHRIQVYSESWVSHSFPWWPYSVPTVKLIRYSLWIPVELTGCAVLAMLEPSTGRLMEQTPTVLHRK